MEDTFAHLFSPLVTKVMRYASNAPHEAIDSITALRLNRCRYLSALSILFLGFLICFDGYLDPDAEFALRCLASLAPAKQATGVKNRRSIPEAIRACRENFIVDIPVIYSLRFSCNILPLSKFINLKTLYRIWVT